MDAERWLRPRARIALATAAVIAVGLWSLLATFAAFAVVWWPDHSILKNSLAQAIIGMILLSSIFVSPVVLAWLWFRDVTWHVGRIGIAIYRRDRLKRSIDWLEITTLRILPFYAVVRSAARPVGHELGWLRREDVSWLREVAKERLGQRIVT